MTDTELTSTILDRLKPSLEIWGVNGPVFRERAKTIILDTLREHLVMSTSPETFASPALYNSVTGGRKAPPTRNAGFPDPGEGYRILRRGEEIKASDEVYDHGGWVGTKDVMRSLSGMFVDGAFVRRRVQPRSFLEGPIPLGTPFFPEDLQNQVDPKSPPG